MAPWSWCNARWPAVLWDGRDDKQPHAHTATPTARWLVAGCVFTAPQSNKTTGPQLAAGQSQCNFPCGKCLVSTGISHLISWLLVVVLDQLVQLDRGLRPHTAMCKETEVHQVGFLSRPACTAGLHGGRQPGDSRWNEFAAQPEQHHRPALLPRAYVAPT